MPANTQRPVPGSTPVVPKKLVLALGGDELAGVLSAAFAKDDKVCVLAADTAEEAARLLGGKAGVVVADASSTPVRTLLHELRDTAPKARTVLADGEASLEKGLDAIRAGCLDYLAAEELDDLEIVQSRIEAALGKTRELARIDRRLDRLRSTVRRLNTARHEVGQRVDLLCTDLVNAYGDLSRQMENVRLRQEALDLFEEADDLEQLLCHLMDWLLRRLGHCNIAIYLSAEETLDLGAYMKYTIAGDKPMTDALAAGVAVRVQKRGVLHVDAEMAAALLTAAEMPYLKGQAVLGVDCTYLAESLATVVCFRDGALPFKQEDAEAVAAVAPHFASMLTAIVREHDAIGDDWDDDDAGEFGSLLSGDDEDESADWWKTGDRAPF